MIRTCSSCDHVYNDEYNWTLCPHVPLGAGPVPWHPVQNPGGYCKEHDLFACKFDVHRGPLLREITVPQEEKMPADKQAPVEGRPSHGCGGVPRMRDDPRVLGRAPDVVGPTGPAEDPRFLRGDHVVPQEVKADRITSQEESERLPRSASYLVRRAVNRLYFNPRASDDQEIATKALLALDQPTGE